MPTEKIKRLLLIYKKMGDYSVKKFTGKRVKQVVFEDGSTLKFLKPTTCRIYSKSEVM